MYQSHPPSLPQAPLPAPASCDLTQQPRRISSLLSNSVNAIPTLLAWKPSAHSLGLRSGSLALPEPCRGTPSQLQSPLCVGRQGCFIPHNVLGNIHTSISIPCSFNHSFIHNRQCALSRSQAPRHSECTVSPTRLCPEGGHV